MVFSSMTFLYAFLPAALLAYYIAPGKLRNGVLLLFGLVFYGWAEPAYLIIMLVCILVNFAAGLLIGSFDTADKRGRSKIIMITAVAVSLLMLGFFKYTNFITGLLNGAFGLRIDILDIALPVGISFYTFQALSYTIDVYRGDVSPQRNLISFSAYITMFPQLIAGPIVRYRDVAAQLTRRQVTLEQFASGVQRFVIGLGKKVLLANQAGALYDELAGVSLTGLPAAAAWLGAAAFAFQIYFDFSGYSDMAIGLGRMLGFEFLENFDYPYQSSSVTEFWRRWHMSLSAWFREYLYIPLGGNKRGLPRTLLNLIIVWAVTGLWHGARWNFVLWGVYFGVILIIEKLFLLKALERLPRFFRHAYTLVAVLFSWVLFFNESLAGVWGYLGAMFGGTGVIADGHTVYLLYTNAVILILCAAGSTELPKRAVVMVRNALSERGWLGAFADTLLCNGYMLGVLIVSTAGLVSESYNPFLYFRF